jgi:RNA polymerase sigma-70 factor (ECF subfamily)
MQSSDDRAWVRDALERYERPLLRFAKSLVGSAHAADVVQDVFLALCKAERSRVEGHLAPWLYTVCRNRAFDLGRERKRTKELVEEDEMESPDSGPASRVERQKEVSRVLGAMEHLTERQREAVMLKFSSGLKYNEIAEEMETSVSNVGVILHTALKAIRKELAETGSQLENARSMP